MKKKTRSYCNYCSYYWLAVAAAASSSQILALEASDVLVFSKGPLSLRPQFGLTEQFDDNIFYEDTDLESQLSERAVGRLVVTGAQTDACIRSTLHGAFTRGYDTVLVGDAHTTEDLSEWGAPSPDLVIAHTNLYWKWQSAPGRTAAVVDTADVSFDRPEEHATS